MTDSQLHTLSNNTSTRSSARATPADNPYLSSGNFAPVLGETTAIDLRVRGRIPDDLEGRRLCIGPSPIGERDPALYHWFTGTGLVHGLRLSGGRAAWYHSRSPSAPTQRRRWASLRSPARARLSCL